MDLMATCQVVDHFIVPIGMNKRLMQRHLCGSLWRLLHRGTEDYDDNVVSCL
jgi:hypothetical protein